MYKALRKNPQLTREILSFIIIGILGTATDFGLYWWWHHYAPYSVAKIFSYICGSCVAYLLNKFITFQQKQHSTAEIIRFAVLYASSMGINVTANSIFIWLLIHFFPFSAQNYLHLILIFSFLAATTISTLINFIGQRFWVFKRRHDLEIAGLV